MIVPSYSTSFSGDISRARCTKENKGNGRFETEYQGQSGSNFSHHAATSDAKLLETLEGMCCQETPPYRHYIQEVNIVINMLLDKDNFSNKFT
jgi:hypothetical protein